MLALLGNQLSLQTSFAAVAISNVAVLRGEILALSRLGDDNDHLLQVLGQQGLLLTNAESLVASDWLERMEEAGSLDRVAAAVAIIREGLGGSRQLMSVVQGSPDEFIHVPRPVFRHGRSEGSSLVSIETYSRRFGPSVRTHPGVTLLEGGSRNKSLSFYPPPSVMLTTGNRFEILQILEYAGIRYQTLESEAANFGIAIFEAGRDFVLRQSLERVSFDWDHTLSDYQIFEDLIGLIKTKMKKEYPEALADQPMTALEIARPFMQELALGMMVGFAIEQGIHRFDQWEQYEPRVHVVTHTWPDRLGILAEHFMRLLPLMEGILPGTPGVYDRFVKGEVQSVVHLHQFLAYAEYLVRQYTKKGLEGLSPLEQDELMAYFEDGKAHYRKPLGLLAQLGWDTSSLLHFDDSTKVIGDFRQTAPHTGAHALFVRHPHSRIFADVQEFHKIALGALVAPSRQRKKRRAARNLVRAEWNGSTVPAILGALLTYHLESASQERALVSRAGLPEGLIFYLHETPTTLGEFWRYYVGPTNQAKEQIRRVLEQHGGLKAIRAEYAAAVQNRIPA